MTEQDTEGGGGLVLVPIRWSKQQIDRADAVVEATGLTRSFVMRSAYDQGIALVEQSVAAVQAPVQASAKVGAVSGAEEPA